MLKIATAVATAASLAVTIAPSTGSYAQDAYPDRPVTMIVPFAAGGPTDALARIVAQGLTEKLGQQVLVENVPGAGGPSAQVAQRARRPTATRCWCDAGTLAANVGLYRKLPYDVVADFDPVGFMGDVPQILIVKKDFPAQTAAEFYAYVKEHDAELTAGTAGVGSASHLGGLLLNWLGTDVELVGYKGAGPAMNDLVGGHIDYMIDVSTTALPQIAASTVRPLAVLRVERIAALPDVPTMVETGLQNMEANIWNLLLAPKGTPQPIVERLTGVLHDVTQDPAVQGKFAQLGIVPPGPDNLPAPQIEAFVEMETARWQGVIKAAGVSADEDKERARRCEGVSAAAG